MIDLDQMDEQLGLAVTTRPVERAVERAVERVAEPAVAEPAVRRAPRRAPVGVDRSVPELLELGLLEEADTRIAAVAGRLDGVTWRTMRALLAGNREAANAGVEELLGLARATDETDTWDRYWAQRFWTAFEWGTEGERYAVLDHCRERAYRFDDLQWWGNLTVLLATMGKDDEAVRAFDEAERLAAGVAKDGRWLDAVTNLIEAAALLGDAGRGAAAHRSLRWPEGRLVVVGPGVVCKGSVDRYRALGHAALAEWGHAAECFRRAESTHRAIGAGPLLDRTLQQASGAAVAA